MSALCCYAGNSSGFLIVVATGELQVNGVSRYWDLTLNTVTGYKGDVEV